MEYSLVKRRWVVALGLLVLLALLILSLFFWKERTVYTDMAFHVFVLSVTKTIAIQNQRFGAAITQAFPLLAMKLQWSLRAVLQLYSASFFVSYIAYFIVIVFVIRNVAMGLVLCLYLTMLTSISFFWAQSEFPQGMAFLVLYLSLLLFVADKEKPSLVLYAIVIAGGVVALFFHPLILFPFTIALSYFYLNKNIQFRQAAYVLLFSVFVLVAKTVLIKTGGYESAKMGGIKNFLTLFPNYFFIPSNIDFVKRLAGDYALLALWTVAVTVWYVAKVQHMKLAWLYASLLGYLLLVNVSFPEAGFNTYTQNLQLPLAFIVALPIAFELVPAMPTKYLVMALLLTFGIRIAFVYHSHAPFTERLNYLNGLLDQQAGESTNKFYVAEKDLDEEVVGETWALSYETLLLSSLQSRDATKTIELEEVVQENAFLLDSDFVFINRMWGWNGSELPSRYFNLKKSKYQKLETNKQ
jgi:hypothetical protein